jgi:hypothetical protein
MAADAEVERDERIRQRAYEIWEREGRPHGREADHWRMAVDELIEELKDAKLTQPFPEDRGSETAKPGAAQPTQPAGPTPQADPIGLAQPSEDTAPAKRSPSRARNAERKPAPAGASRSR